MAPMFRRVNAPHCMRRCDGWTFYSDAFATPCLQPADLDCSGTVDGADLAQILSEWGLGHSAGDINGSGAIDGVDFGILLAAWGSAS